MQILSGQPGIAVKANMILEAFEALDINAQANAVWDGKFVSSHLIDDVFVQLYRLDDFYVKVYL
ncbi:MAG: hypothetical protein V4553_16230 [Bacteroidota bacterium]